VQTPASEQPCARASGAIKNSGNKRSMENKIRFTLLPSSLKYVGIIIKDQGMKARNQQ